MKKFEDAAPKDAGRRAAAAGALLSVPCERPAGHAPHGEALPAGTGCLRAGACPLCPRHRAATHAPEGRRPSA